MQTGIIHDVSAVVRSWSILARALEALSDPCLLVDVSVSLCMRVCRCIYIDNFDTKYLGNL